ncbi:MAG: sulfatase [Verrucomicrobia bacterium]|nr:sulfatase [Verrucomicrobiota bacterium]
MTFTHCVSNWRGFLPITLVILALLSPSTEAAPARKTSTPPNIVLIISDDHAWNDYSFMGHPEVRTPNLDRLAAQSLTFERGYVPASLCCPSLASILTGQYPHKHKVTSNDPPMPEGVPRREAYKLPEVMAGRERMNRFVEEIPTLPRLLSEQGYLTFQTGKWWQGNFRRGGFTHGMTDGNPETGGRHGDAGLQIGRKTMQPIYDFIGTAQQEKKPFMVWYAPMMPHQLHNPPERLLKKYRDKTPSLHVAKYWAMIEWFDETCGDLLNHLEREGLAENTIIAYVSDNGWIQQPDKADYGSRSKQSQYDTGLRSPIMVRWLVQAKPENSPALASSIDFMPTLLTAAGVPVPRGLPGINLLDKKAVAKRKMIFGECFTHDSADLDRPEKSLRWRWGIEGDWKVILPDPVNEPNGVVELYNLKADPFEAQNLAHKEKRRIAALTKKVDAWWPGR